METGKPGLASVPAHIRSIAAPAEKEMDMQAPLTAVYIHTAPYSQPPAAAPEPSTLHLSTPPLYSKETLPFLTLHLAGGVQSLPGLSVVTAAPTAKPKSAGKHVCPHCGRDCMKPSVLEKHLRCHTGERPYPCTTCGVSFKTQSNLYKHRRTQAHARLSSESEQSSVDSTSSSRDTCTSSLSLDERSDESGSVESTRLPAAESASPTRDTEMQREVTVTETSWRDELGKDEDKQTAEKPPLLSRHLPLQRQQAMLFSKQRESSACGGKSQSHGSTDSGFSESSDHYPSPGSVLPDHSMDSLAESNTEHQEDSTRTHTPSEGSRREAKDTAREQEQKILEERISKLISENTAVVEDKQLENVRPRKTVLSKQGSIDLPMPYTYKDSFHFDMKISPAQHIALQRHIQPGLCSSVPTQRSCSTVEHAPLTRSNSLPFSVALLQPERSSPTSSHHSDYVSPSRRGSSGQINPTYSAMRPVSQHSSTHRPLVRQTAVDCNHAADGLFSNSSSVEEVCDGDGGDICDESNSRKIRRKKPQKFFYKWYMYRGGTFKRLYSAETTGDNGTCKGRKGSTNPEVVQGLQKPQDHKETGSTASFTNSAATVGPATLAFVSPVVFSHLNSSVRSPLRRNLSLSVLPLPSTGSLVSHKAECVSRAEAERPVDVDPHAKAARIPSDRKKQRTDEIVSSLEMLNDPNTVTGPPPSAAANVLLKDANLTFINLPKDPKHTEMKGAVFLPSLLKTKAPSVDISPSTSLPSSAKSSFLPKYQLKLPNAPDPDPKGSPPVVGEPKGRDDYAFTAASSSATDQTLPSATACTQNCGNAVQTCDIGRVTVVTSTQQQLALTCTVTPLSQAAPLASSLTVVHRQFATTTKTTSCLQDSPSRLCSTLIQPLKSVAGSVPPQLPRPSAPAAANLSPTTVNNQTSAATVSALSQSQPHLSPNAPLSLSNPGNKALVRSNTPALPLNHAQNVFHVHTADLQICLQIISDEQLALIAPQIDRTPDMNLPQTRDAEAMSQHDAEKKAHNSVTVGQSNEAGNQQHQRTDDRKSVAMLNTETRTPPLAVGDPGPQLAEHSKTNQAAASVQSNSLPDQTLNRCDGVNSAGSRTSEQVPPLRDGRFGNTESQHKLPDPRASCKSSRLDSEVLSQVDSAAHVLASSLCTRNSEAPGQMDSQPSLCQPEEPASDQSSSKPADMQGNSDNSSSSSGVTTSQDAGKHRSGGSSVSSNIQTERFQNNTAVCTRIQSLTAEDCEGQLLRRGHAGTTVQPEKTGWRLEQRRDQAETHHWTRGDKDGGGGTTGEDRKRGISETEAPSVLSDVTRIKGEDTKIQVDCMKNSCLPEQHLQDLSQTHSGMSKVPPSAPQKAPAAFSSSALPPSSLHTSLRSPTPLEMQQSWDGTIHHQQTQASREPSLNHMTAQVHFAEIHHGFTKAEAYFPQTHAVSHQHQQQTMISVSSQPTSSSTGSYNTSVSCGSPLASKSAHSNQASPLCTTTPALTGDVQKSKDSQSTGPPCRSATFPGDTTSQSSDSGSKYQSVFMGGLLHGFQPADFLTGGIRPVQSCYTEDTSSSDDEGKLIIEL